MSSSLLELLPLPHNQEALQEEEKNFEAMYRSTKKQENNTKFSPPSYGSRQGFVPRKPQDFGDGGAFPEIHVPQFPLNMGREDSSSKKSTALSLTLDSSGKVNYEALLQQNSDKKIIYSKSSDLMPFNATEKGSSQLLMNPSQEEIQETTDRTRQALEKIVDGKIKAARPKQLAEKKAPAQYIRYTSQSEVVNGGGKQRVFRISEVQRDPLDPPDFKVKRVPGGPPSPPAPVMHSPPRKLTKEDIQDWTIPPCNSNWKNQKGFTVSLDKRLASDGRRLQQIEIGTKFAEFDKALTTAQRVCAEEINTRKMISKRISHNVQEEKDRELAEIAARARNARLGIPPPANYAAPTFSSSSSFDASSTSRTADRPQSPELEEDHNRRDRQQENSDEESDRRGFSRHSPSHSPVDTERRESGSDSLSSSKRHDAKNRFLEERRREIERELRLENFKKTNKKKMEERDISERIALGSDVSKKPKEAQFDQRLFNQSQGVSDGFGADDAYSLYDKPLFRPSAINQVFRPNQKDSGGDFDADEFLEEVNKKKQFKPDKNFKGASDEATKPRSGGPLEFERGDIKKASYIDSEVGRKSGHRGTSDDDDDDDDDDDFGFEELASKSSGSAKKSLEGIIGRGSLAVAAGGNLESVSGAPLESQRKNFASSSVSSSNSSKVEGGIRYNSFSSSSSSSSSNPDRISASSHGRSKSPRGSRSHRHQSRSPSPRDSRDRYTARSYHSSSSSSSSSSSRSSNQRDVSPESRHSSSSYKRNRSSNSGNEEYDNDHQRDGKRRRY